MASMIDVFNMALSNIAARAFVQSLTEDSNERKYCSANIDNAMESILEDHDWGFASSYENLALLKKYNDTVPPPKPWLYQYSYPTLCIKVREIVRLSDNDSEIPFKVDLSNDIKVIHTDIENAILRYTKRISNLALFSPRAVEALGWKLSTRIVIPLTHNLKLKQNAEQSYVNALAEAKTSSFNENVNRPEREPELILARS